MPIERIPLTQPINTRNGFLNTDSKCVNGYFESSEGMRMFVKRPGLIAAPDIPSLPAGKGQGIYTFQNNVYAVVNNVLYKMAVPSFATTVVGSLSGPIATCYFVQTLDEQYLFLHNGTNGYLLNGTTGVFSQITNDKVAVTTIITGGSGYTAPTVVFDPPPSGTTATGTVQMTSGIITGITITDGGSGYVTAPNVTINDPTGMGAAATCLLNFFPTSGLVPGAIFLDSYVIVGTPQGRLYSSNVGDPTTWNALDYISAEAQPDLSIGIARHLNYVLNFGQWSTEFFYDAGNPIASPLNSAPSYQLEIGCLDGNTIVAFDQTVMWVGTSKTGSNSVYLLDGVSPVKVSSTYIDRILNRSPTDLFAYAMKYNGHTFYVLTSHLFNVTIVYDVNEKVWVQWTMWATDDAGNYGEQYFRPLYYTYIGITHVLLDDDNGKIYGMSENFYTDSGAPIYYRSVTNLIDNGTTKRKFYNRVEIVGDKVAATMNIRHTDNDYQSWSPYRAVNLNQSRPQIYQTGAARRRAWEFLCTDNVPLRLDCAEIDFNIGELEQDGVGPTQYRK